MSVPRAFERCAWRVACAVAVACIAPAFTSRADTMPVGARQPARFLSTRAGVGLETPPGWSLSLHTGYPNVLCVLIHPQGSRISVAVDRATAADSSALVAENRPGLAAQGLTIDRVSPGPLGGVLVDARPPRHNQALRQLYLVRPVATGPDPRQAVVLTLTTTADQLAAASGAFDWVMAHLELREPVRPDDKPDNKPDRPDGGGA